MTTTQEKLEKILQTKSALRTLILGNGSEMPYDTPFRLYTDYISELIQGIEPTSSVQDIMQLADLQNECYEGKWDEHVYTEQEQQDFVNLVNLICDGGTDNE